MLVSLFGSAPRDHMTTEHLDARDGNLCGSRDDQKETRDIDAEFEKVLSEQKHARLSALLTQATMYSKFLAEKIQTSSSKETAAKSAGLERKVLQPALLTGVTLKDYQLEGLAWLVSLFENGLNGILADEMGLGKTIQTIAFLTFLIEKQIPGPFLIVGPLSTIANWSNEWRKCALTVPVLMYHGSADERKHLRAHFLPREARKTSASTAVLPVVITTYEMVMRDKRHLSKFPWKYIVVDEGHRLKNLDCKLIRDLKAYSSYNRLILTGTPLQNNLTELWSLLHFLLPDVFDDIDTFHAWFSSLEQTAVDDIERDVGIVDALHTILKPFLLRRLKADVERQLPLKREVLLFMPLTAKQQEFYDAILAKNFIKRRQDLKKSEALKSRRRSTAAAIASSPKCAIKDSEDADAESEIAISASTLQNVVMQLRKVCNHPFLFEHPVDAEGDFIADRRLIEVSAKMAVLEQIVDRLQLQKANPQHKLLIFSQMTRMLDILEHFCHLKHLAFCRIDGSTPQADRSTAIRRFNEEAAMGVFLLSTRAGGLGINLTAADTVVIFDSDWNPQVDLQAQDRCHRIGQQKAVVVLRLVTRHTVEHRILQRAAEKRQLERVVIFKERFKSVVTRDVIIDDLRAILRQKMAVNEPDTEAAVTTPKAEDSVLLSEEDLNAALNRDPQLPHAFETSSRIRLSTFEAHSL